jgi:tellurite resistance protein TerC
MLLIRQDTLAPGDNPLVRLARRWVPVTDTYHGRKFIVRVDGKLMATPLLLSLLLVESSDVMFAVDSIPAIFAVTRDPFIIFTSNIFAILGLRSLYFVLAAYMERFRYLKHALVFVLAYVGVKMIISNHFHIEDLASMAIIFGILMVGVLASLRGGARDPVPLRSPFD